jgi:hypothetical protein
MAIGERADDDGLNEPERSADPEFVAGMNGAMSLGWLAVDRELAIPACLLGF